MTTFHLIHAGLRAEILGALRLRDGGVRAGVSFFQGDQRIFAHTTNWTDGIERAAVAQELAGITGLPPEQLIGDLLHLEEAIDTLERQSLGSQESQLVGAPEWPEPPNVAAFAGVAGRVVTVAEPFSEADPVGILLSFVVAVGNSVGNGPYFSVGATRHGLNLFVGLVGDTAKARKGDSWTPIRWLMRRSAIDWTERVMSGISSGEGLIWHVRDAIEKREPVKEKGRTVGYELVIADEGVSDKRLLAMEPELARALAAMSRSGNTLSSVIREAWDHGNLNVLTKTNTARATGAHISILAHITREELHRVLTEIEVANGFANRFLWGLVRRSKLLPEPEPFGGPEAEDLVTEIGSVLAHAAAVGELRRDSRARDLWAEIYPDLSRARPGLAGSILARAEAQTMRLASIYALLDGSPVVTADHVLSALELHAYCERSVHHIWGESLGDPIADTINRSLRQIGRLSRSEISNLLGRHVSAAQIDSALQRLTVAGRARPSSQPTAGRPTEYWETVA